MVIKGNKTLHIVYFKNFTLSRNGTIELSIEDWSWEKGQHWLLSGDNDSGMGLLAEYLIRGLARAETTGQGALNVPRETARLVSFAEAARLIEYERTHDDSDFTEGGVDAGRTAYGYLSARSGLSLDEIIAHPAVNECGVTRYGDRGIKYLSTGETRRLLLCEALVSDAPLIALEDPLDGVDESGRKAIVSLLETYMRGNGTLMLVAERPESIPKGITHAIEFQESRTAYQGTLDEYLKIREAERREIEMEEDAQFRQVAENLGNLVADAKPIPGSGVRGKPTPLVEMRGVTVEWSGRKVLDSLDWKLEAGQHWLIRGPNGSGKTTFLELITGDNPQVFRNDVRLFGNRRGSGETIWEIKERMGIVSYRMHVEFRMVGDMDAESVVLSGFHDSIGLYRQKGTEETRKARSWLALGGFAGRETERFSELSYGDQRAILILRAVVKSPPILILDEPCHGLDDRHRLRVLDLLESIGNSGRTTLLHVTHDPTEVLPCERHVLELRPGETPMYRTLMR